MPFTGTACRKVHANAAALGIDRSDLRDLSLTIEVRMDQQRSQHIKIIFVMQSGHIGIFTFGKIKQLSKGLAYAQFQGLLRTVAEIVEKP